MSDAPVVTQADFAKLKHSLAQERGRLGARTAEVKRLTEQVQKLQLQVDAQKALTVKAEQERDEFRLRLEAQPAMLAAAPAVQSGPRTDEPRRLYGAEEDPPDHPMPIYDAKHLEDQVRVQTERPDYWYTSKDAARRRIAELAATPLADTVVVEEAVA